MQTARGTAGITETAGRRSAARCFRLVAPPQDRTAREEITSGTLVTPRATRSRAPVARQPGTRSPGPTLQLSYNQRG
jgi:hypothetical protein